MSDIEVETTPTPEQIAARREQLGRLQERYRAELALLRPPAVGCVDTSPFYRRWRP
jgi:hypothetical protein